MRLISTRIQGYGRLVDTKVNLDAKLIAIVGPNEAGKTTLLKALAYIDSDESLPISQRSRAVDVDDDTTVIALKYVLNDEDREAVADLDLEEEPQTLTVGRKAGGGGPDLDVRPTPKKAFAPLVEAAAQLRNAMEHVDLENWVDPSSIYADPTSDEAHEYATELMAVADGVDSTVGGGLETELEIDLVETGRSLLSATKAEPESAQLRNGLTAVVSWFERENPIGSACNELWGRTPDFLLFDEADRLLESAYPFDDGLLAEVPNALKNLLDLGKLDLASLYTVVQAGDIARRETMIAQANSRLDSVFADAWKQSRLSVELSLDGPLLRVAIREDGDQITVFNERSAGLRTFVAIIAFLNAHNSKRRPILLIDEAENHLHIDAQADLVNMFVTQPQALKVVYTTHSPACLPPDLGSGIRLVVPRTDHPQISDIKNSFWQGSAGFSPLMLAMGAAAAAFTPARYVVLGEGATEMILLPTLVREATGDAELRYQVAPGLSEVPKDFYTSLDLEGAKVAYLLDGNGGGAELERRLIGAGVSKELIVRLNAPGLENTLKPEVYGEAVLALLKECNPDAQVRKLPNLPDSAEGPWSKVVNARIESNGLRTPSKVAVANWLIENDKAKPSRPGITALRAAHKQLMKSLAR